MSPSLQQTVHQQLQTLLPQLALDFTPALHLKNDLGLDSLGVVELVITLEQHFNVTFPDAEISGWHTLADVYDTLERHEVEQSASWWQRGCRFFR